MTSEERERLGEILYDMAAEAMGSAVTIKAWHVAPEHIREAYRICAEAVACAVAPAGPPRPAYILQEHSGRFHLFESVEALDRWREANPACPPGYMGPMSVQEWIWHPRRPAGEADDA